jgi:hypothetical protein
MLILIKGFSHEITVPLSSQRNDWALANIEQVHKGAQDMFWTHIWQRTLARPSSQEGSRDQARVEAAHQVEGTMTILEACRRLSEAKSE